MGKTSIEWTAGDDGSAGSVWNPVRGCSRLSPGCGGANHQGGCYAEKIAARFSGPGQPFEGFAERTAHGGRWTGKMALVDDMLTVPLRWKKPRRIFVNSMSDLFHDDLPDEAIDRVFAVMALCPQHTFQVLTKRSARMRAWFEERWQGTPAQDIRMPDGEILHCPRGGETGRRHQIEQALRAIADERGMIDPDVDEQWDEKGRLKIARFDWPLPNVWLGVSVEDQTRADERIPDLLATPAAVRFLSCEPLLGPVDLLKWFDPTGACCGGEPEFRCDNCPADAEWRFSGQCTAESLNEPRLDWVIVGSESGPRSRPCDINWVRAIKDQCVSAGAAFFWKQHAANGRKITTPELDGRRWMEMPGARDNG